MKNTESKFVKEVKARQKKNGNTTDPLAIVKKAESAIDSQISGLQYQITEKETELEAAEARLTSPIYPTEDITNPKAYCQRIADAQLAVDTAEAELTATEESLAYFQTLKSERF